MFAKLDTIAISTHYFALLVSTALLTLHRKMLVMAPALQTLAYVRVILDSMATVLRAMSVAAQTPTPTQPAVQTAPLVSAMLVSTAMD